MRKRAILLSRRAYDALDHLTKSCLMDVCVSVACRLPDGLPSEDDIMAVILDNVLAVAKARKEALPRYHPGHRDYSWFSGLLADAKDRAAVRIVDLPKIQSPIPNP